jgi:penicillin amidase
MPIRDPKAMTYDPVTQMGLSPAMILPGDGTAEWIGFLEDRYIPHDINPAKGFIATANNDLVGQTEDGNPFNDAHYATWDSDIGHRIARITERLEGLTTKGGVTPEDMMSIQGDHKSPLGALLAPAFVSAAKRAAEERSTPGTHPELTAVVTGADPLDLDRLADAASRLEAWKSFEAPAGVDIGDGEPPAGEVTDSIAASIFNASMLQVVKFAFGDETDAIGRRPSGGNTAKVLQWAILDPQRLATYDAQIGDTVLWDDLTTAAVKETRDAQIVRGMLAGLAVLKGKLGDDVKQWQWGKLHTVKFEALVPAVSGDSEVTIPRPGDAKFPDGFPRGGDNFGVDASNFGMWNPEKFAYGSGPVQRLVVEMTKDGPRIWNALPGGQSFDPDSKHHADEAELWRRNQATPIFFTEPDVKEHGETTVTFVP